MPKIILALLAFCTAPFAAFAQETLSFGAQVDAFFKPIVDALATVLFFDIFGFQFIVLWLLVAGLFFTFRLGFINFRLFPHAFALLRRAGSSEGKGEISPFQALCSAISGTVGLGSIAGISVAVAVGGPGAILWIMVGGFLGMASKYAEVVLSLCYRKIDDTGKVYGGPLHYIKDGLHDIGLPRFGKFLAIIFALFCLGGAIGGGNMFQSNQAVKILTNTFEVLRPYQWVLALAIAASVGIILLGSIKRVAIVADKLTPLKGGLYLICCLIIILFHLPELPHALVLIMREAFTADAATGGFIGMLALAFKRAFFANEAGLGSAPTAHAAGRIDDPVQAGTLALLEPFFAAMIALLTGLTVTVTGAYTTGSLEDGVLIASRAFETVAPWFPILLAINVLLFAYGCILGWSYYGEIAWTYLFGKKTIRLYQLLFCTITFLGGIMHFGVVLDFSDLLILGMALPNLIAVYLLTPRIVRETKAYLARLKS